MSAVDPTSVSPERLSFAHPSQAVAPKPAAQIYGPGSENRDITTDSTGSSVALLHNNDTPSVLNEGSACDSSSGLRFQLSCKFCDASYTTVQGVRKHVKAVFLQPLRVSGNKKIPSENRSSPLTKRLLVNSSGLKIVDLDSEEIFRKCQKNSSIVL